MTEETLLTAARRVVRFVRINESHDGGLLDIETVRAVEMLDTMVRAEESKTKNAPQG